MERPFTETDNGKRFFYHFNIGPWHDLQGRLGRLEYPLVDPGSAKPGEGIIWFTEWTGKQTWVYVSPDQVSEVKDHCR